MNITELFPFPRFLPHQKETLEQIQEAIDSNTKLIMLNAPTGAGKSGICTAVCRYFDDAYYLTPLKKLQTQIMNDAYLKDYYIEIKGRSNYICKERSTGAIQYSCAEGNCQSESNYTCASKLSGECAYWNAKFKAINNNIVLSNYAYFLGEGMIPRSDYTLQWNRDVIITDEMDDDTHTAGFISVTLSNHTLDDYVYRELENGMAGQDEVDAEFIASAIFKLNYRWGELEGLTAFGLSDEQTKEKAKLERLNLKLQQLLDSLNAGDKWVVTKDNYYSKTNRKTYTRLVYEPVYVGKFAQQLLWDRADYFIVSSATILDPKDFCERMGWIDEYAYLDVPSSFPPENRPFIDAAVGKMTNSEREQNLPIAIQMLEHILDIEKDTRGIIHTTSYDNSLAIENMLDKKYHERMIYTKPNSTHYNDRIVQEWIDTCYPGDNRVLCGAAMTRGLDLKDDLARFGVMFKVGYPSIGNKRVKAKLDDNKWDEYWIDAARDVIQAAGRYIRHPEDYGRFYVIDQSFQDVVNRVQNHMPSWFTAPEIKCIDDLEDTNNG